MRRKIDIVHEPGLDGLRIAIVKQAIMDYESSLKRMNEIRSKSGDDFWITNRMKTECERFFLGTWFSMLCELSGAYIMDLVEKEVM